MSDITSGLVKEIVIAGDKFHMNRGRKPTHFTVCYDDEYEFNEVIGFFSGYLKIVPHKTVIAGMQFAGFTDTPGVCVMRLQEGERK